MGLLAVRRAGVTGVRVRRGGRPGEDRTHSKQPQVSVQSRLGLARVLHAAVRSSTLSYRTFGWVGVNIDTRPYIGIGNSPGGCKRGCIRTWGKACESAGVRKVMERGYREGDWLDWLEGRPCCIRTSIWRPPIVCIQSIIIKVHHTIRR